MESLSPIMVNGYTVKYKKLITDLNRAALMLLPDAYYDMQEQLLQAKALLEHDQKQVEWFLNECSAGVVFNESINVTVEQNVNSTVVSILMDCQDKISSFLLLGEELDEYVTGLTVDDAMLWKMPKLVECQNVFDRFAVDLNSVYDTCSVIIEKLSN